MKLYETFWRRVGAAIIDALVLSPASLVLVFALRGGVALRTYVILGLILPVINAAYTVLMTAHYGQTVGKMSVGVRIARLNGAPIRAKEAALRYLPVFFLALAINLASAIALSDEDVVTVASITRLTPWINAVNWTWILAQLITIGSNQHRRAIHDYLAETQVVVAKCQDALDSRDLPALPPQLPKPPEA